MARRAACAALSLSLSLMEMMLPEELLLHELGGHARPHCVAHHRHHLIPNHFYAEHVSRS